jgi:hypothetical protein
MILAVKSEVRKILVRERGKKAKFIVHQRAREDVWMGIMSELKPDSQLEQPIVLDSYQ